MVIDGSGAHFRDDSAVTMLDTVALRFSRHAIEVALPGMNVASATLFDRFGRYDKEGAPLSEAH